MKIVHTSGGLANQMLQYIFKRYLEIETNEEHYICDLLYHINNYMHNGFELDKIFPNIKLKTTSNLLGNEATLNVINEKKKLGNEANFPNLLINNGVELDTIISESTYWGKHIEIDSFIGERIRISGSNDIYNKVDQFLQYNYYVIGVWWSKNFFDSIKTQILHELTFQDIPDEKNKGYLSLINSTISVGIHVRRGDFTRNGWALPAEKYAPAISQFRDKIVNLNQTPTFFVFSDDSQWCKDNYSELGFLSKDEVIFVEGNTSDSKNYIDMQLMTYCKYLISNSRSSFSQVASWLNQELIEQIRITETQEEKDLRAEKLNAETKKVEEQNEMLQKITSIEQDLKNNIVNDNDNIVKQNEISQKISTLEKTIDTLNNKVIPNLEQNIIAQKNANTQLISKLEQKEVIITQLISTIATIEQQNNELLAQIKENNKQINALTKSKTKEFNKVNGQLKWA